MTFLREGYNQPNKKRRINVDLTQDHGLEFEIKDKIDFQIETGTPKKRRPKVEPQSMPEDLVQVEELTIFRPKAETDGREFEELEIHIGACLQLEENITLEGETRPIAAGYFVRVSEIMTSNKGQFITGKLFKRARYCYNLFEKTAGELVWLKDKVTVKASHAVRVRELVLTNYVDLTCGDIFPREDAWVGDDSGRLICRWRANILDNGCGKAGSAKNMVGDDGSIRMLQGFEVDECFALSLKNVKEMWMAGRNNKVSEKENINRNDAPQHSNQSIQVTKWQYTFGDFFCGAGGASCGAKMAGLMVAYGIDFWEDAIESYALNYGKRKAILEDICNFAAGTSSFKIPASRLHADVIHLSCPCQFFSPAHTVPGKDDEKNEVASLVVDRLLKVVRPRIVTMEQTFGISTTTKFKDHFAIVINQFVRNHYSVRWAVKNATEYGAVSARKRLIVIASCPGETLPPFPAATTYNPFHLKVGVNDRGLPTTPTIGQVLASIPNNAENHTFSPYPQPRLSPFRFDQPFNKTITCGGGESKVHPSGTRPFTVRELATFQTFPVDYKFGNASNTKIIKQIGNAWPPNFARAIYEAIVQHLEWTDRDQVL
ncbi:hypothetical protein ABW20_dc0109581 [Dactylellina cionopaga]|nr:hypothetical protein ABW20_dc0109581 [Dactylellina cionopaga]